MASNMLNFFGSHVRMMEEWRKMLPAAESRVELMNKALDRLDAILEIAWIGSEDTATR